MMAAATTVSDLQAVDFGFGRVLVAAYEGLAPCGPAAFQRFLSRDKATKIFRADNEDLRTLQVRIAGKVSNGNTLLDLPVIAYYHFPGLSESDEKPRSYALTRYSDDRTTNSPCGSSGRRKAGYGSEGLFDGDAGYSYRQRKHRSG